MAYATWLPDVLTAAGVKVVTYPGWATRSSLGKRNPGPAGPLATTRPAVLWHHDASPPGDSPGALNNWMRPQLAVPGAASANVWVDRAGTWHILAAGTTWHAGDVNDSRWSNNNSIGIETDHTTGEDWPPALLSSLRRGTAAILTHVGRTPEDGLNFHKHVALPRGSKVDPDGLDLTYERATVGALMTNPTQGEDDMADPATQAQLARIENLLSTGRADRGIGSESWPWAYGYFTEALMSKVDQANLTIAAQSAALKALVAAQGADPAVIEATVKDAVKDALDGLRIVGGESK